MNCIILLRYSKNNETQVLLYILTPLPPNQKDVGTSKFLFYSIENEEPHPHVVLACGFLITKCFTFGSINKIVLFTLGEG